MPSLCPRSSTLFVLAACLLATVTAFGSFKQDSAAPDEWACRAKHVEATIRREELVADCASTGIVTLEQCEAQMAEEEMNDMIGCGPAPIPTRMTYSGSATGSDLSSGLCKCCTEEIGDSEYNSQLCELTWIEELCPAACGLSGENRAFTLEQKMLIRLLKQRLADSGALPPSGRALQLGGGFGSAFAMGQSLAQRMLDNMLAGLTDEQKCELASRYLDPPICCELNQFAAVCKAAKGAMELATGFFGRRQEEIAADGRPLHEQKNEDASPGLVDGGCEDAAAEVAAKIFEDGGAAYRSCAEAKEAGLCGDELAQYYCAASCGWCLTDDGSQLGDKCEDAADEIVKELAKEALGRTLSSCAELKDIVGACDHDMAKTHCPASCGKCDEAGAMDRASNRRELDKCGGTAGG